MTSTRSYQVTTFHPTYGPIGTQCRLTLPQAQQVARLNNASAVRNQRPERYVVESTRTERRMDAMTVMKGVA